jgi:hypothetical protein
MTISANRGELKGLKLFCRCAVKCRRLAEMNLQIAGLLIIVKSGVSAIGLAVKRFALIMAVHF